MASYVRCKTVRMFIEVQRDFVPCAGSVPQRSAGRLPWRGGGRRGGGGAVLAERHGDAGGARRRREGRKGHPQERHRVGGGRTG